jgi:hypothetical protein
METAYPHGCSTCCVCIWISWPSFTQRWTCKPDLTRRSNRALYSNSVPGEPTSRARRARAGLLVAFLRAVRGPFLAIYKDGFDGAVHAVAALKYANLRCKTRTSPHRRSDYDREARESSHPPPSGFGFDFFWGQILDLIKKIFLLCLIHSQVPSPTCHPSAWTVVG